MKESNKMIIFIKSKEKSKKWTITFSLDSNYFSSNSEEIANDKEGERFSSIGIISFYIPEVK